MPDITAILALMIPITALMIPIVAIITSHRHRELEMRLKLQQGDGNVATELRELKSQLAELRDTSTHYDMSFDSALQRIESRVGNLEGRVSSVEQQANIQNTNR
jgi:hypothetical protein